MSYMVIVKESLDVTRCSFYISGDSERIIRCIKVFLLCFKEDGKISTKYPLQDLYHNYVPNICFPSILWILATGKYTFC